MSQEPLQLVSIDRYPELQTVFLSDWPRSLLAYNALETQMRLKKEGFKHEFLVYCPFGDVQNGFVAVNEKAAYYEITIQYPKDDTKVLEDALRTTKVIDWDRRITLAFAAYHVVSCVQKVIEDKNVEMDLLPSDTFVLEKDSPLFEDVSLPPGFTFDRLSANYVDLIDSKWPHRYPTSTWYFHMLLDTKSGYGLYKDGELTSWIFIGESGFLVHLYTLEGHRKQGYAELILKLISNELFKQKRDVFAFCVKGNKNAYQLYNKVGFKKSLGICWGFLEPTDTKGNGQRATISQQQSPTKLCPVFLTTPTERHIRTVKLKRVQTPTYSY